MRNGKIKILIKQKFGENFSKTKNFHKNEVENFVENTSNSRKFSTKINEFCSFILRSSFNENFDGNPSSYTWH